MRLPRSASRRRGRLCFNEGVDRLTCEPIGYVRTGMALKFDAPHQPNSESGEVNRIELLKGHKFDLALQDLAGFERIWLVWWFHRNQTWRPRVIPPRGAAVRRGVFATRAPHRPNPIGLTCVQLLGVEGLTLTVGPLDLVDGTPILDIKPYIRTIDAFPESRMGWIDAMEADLAAAPRYSISVVEPATAQLAWLEARGIDFSERAFELLSVDPSPHRTRRILQLKDGRRRMACGPWRLFFRVHDQEVVIEAIGKGYSDASLVADGFEKIPDRDAQLEFSRVWSPTD